MNEPGRGESKTPAYEPELPQQKPWRRRWQVYAAVGWSSFLMAALATMLFFAFVDPAEYEWMGGETPEATRMTGYALGFFFFWLVTALTGFVVAYLIRSTRSSARRRRTRDRTSANG